MRGSAHAVTWNQARFVNVNGNIDVHESHDDWKQLQQKVALHQTQKQSSCCLRVDSIAVCQNLSFLSLSLTVGFISILSYIFYFWGFLKKNSSQKSNEEDFALVLFIHPSIFFCFQIGLLTICNRAKYTVNRWGPSCCEATAGWWPSW